jgi:hypothetical protein
MTTRLLTISLIPKTAWYQNVRSTVPANVWQEIRALYLKRQCQYCGTKHDLNLHEVWKYDDVLHVQKLVGFETACFLCHNIRHLGLAQIFIEQGILDRKELTKHYCRVNDCNEFNFREDAFEAMRVWEERSKFKWILDLSYLSKDVMARLELAHKWMEEHPEAVKQILDHKKVLL